jgi:hypothetical protein
VTLNGQYSLHKAYVMVLMLKSYDVVLVIDYAVKLIIPAGIV